MTPRLRLLAAAAVFSLGSTAWAGPPPAADPCAGRSQASCHAPGVVDKPAIKVARGGISAAEGQQLTDRAKKMLEVVMQAPLLKPEGMSLHPTITVEGPPAHAVKHHPALVRTTLLAKPIKLEDKSSSQDKKTGAWMGTGEGPILRLNANDLGVFLSNDTLDLSKPAQFFSAPRQVGEVQGFPVYAVGGNEVLMISKGNTLPWRPFPVESYFQMLISQEQETQDLFKKQLSSTKGPDRAELEKTLAERQATIDSLKQQLAQLSPAQRQAGACQSAKRKRGDPTGLDLTCPPNATPLMVANQDIFARPSPKGSLQFMTISTTWGVLPKDDRMPNTLGRVMRASLQEMDLKALQAMLD